LKIATDKVEEIVEKITNHNSSNSNLDIKRLNTDLDYRQQFSLELVKQRTYLIQQLTDSNFTLCHDYT